MPMINTQLTKLSSKKHSYELLLQLLETLDFEIDDFAKENKVAISYSNPEYELDEIYAIATMLFGDVKLEYYEETGHDVSDYYYKTETEIDNKAYRIITSEYCYGDNTVFDGESVWKYIKAKCERKAKKENVEICWYDEDGEFYPDNDEFSDLCNDVLDELGGLEKISQKVKNKKKIKVKIYKNIVKDLIKRADELNYKILEEIITTKFNDLLNSNDEYYLFEYKYE